MKKMLDKKLIGEMNSLKREVERKKIEEENSYIFNRSIAGFFLGSVAGAGLSYFLNDFYNIKDVSEMINVYGLSCFLLGAAGAVLGYKISSRRADRIFNRLEDID